MLVILLIFRQKVLILHSETNKKQLNEESDYTIYQDARCG